MPVTTEPVSWAAHRSLLEAIWSYPGPIDEALSSPGYYRPGGLVRSVTATVRVPSSSPITVDLLKMNVGNGAETVLVTLPFPANGRAVFFEAVEMDPLARDEMLLCEVTSIGGGDTEDLAVIATFQQ